MLEQTLYIHDQTPQNTVSDQSALLAAHPEILHTSKGSEMEFFWVEDKCGKEVWCQNIKR